MKPTNSKTKAEDILSDESFSEIPGNENLQDDQKFDKEFELARDIRNAARSTKVNLHPEQKLLLDQRIIASIKRKKRKKNLLWISSAAVFLILIGITTLFTATNKSDIRQFATSELSFFDSEYTRLLLPNEKEIQIISQESKIAYSANGTEINIETQGNSEQPLPEDEVVFNSLVVPFGKRSRVTLPDNTIVWLNSGTKLTYPVKFAPDKREVYLEGEARFEVSHNANYPFYVLTRNLDIKVMGTIFNLCAYNDDQTVSTVLESGSVELRFKSKLLGLQTKAQMVPGMMAVYTPHEKSIVQTAVNTKNFTSWKDGYLIFEKNTLGTIVKKLSRYYNTEIVFEQPELAAETFSGYLDLRTSALRVLEIISEITALEVKQDGPVIRIKKLKQPEFGV